MGLVEHGLVFDWPGWECTGLNKVWAGQRLGWVSAVLRMG